MKNYLTFLYETDIRENEDNPITTPSVREDELYETLQAILKKEEFFKVVELMGIYSDRLDKECEVYFKKGFRYAVRFILECFNEKF
ncbi:MAG: hypothetical protein E7343_06530 [Clostridiales bacterium]|nr:hypothetical protein [Clostridiales bacterium]MBE5753697.1 hypothetical protein [Clostridiales bacterium]